MDLEVQQVSLRWPTPSGRLNPRAFRKSVGFALGKLTHQKGTDWGWLFNAAASQPEGKGIATIRFSTGNGRNGPFAQIVAVGDEACSRLAACLPDLLPAIRSLGITHHAIVDYNRVWIKPSSSPQPFRVQTVVLTRLKGDQALYDRHRADPSLTIPFLKDAVAAGINRQAERIGLPSPELTPEQVGVIEISRLGTQPVHKGKREAMLSRLSQAKITLPCRLNGDWRVGGLLTYGNGLVTSCYDGRQQRQPSVEEQPYPKMRHLEEKAA